MVPVTALTAGLLAVLFLVLSARTISARRAARISVGPGEDKTLLRAMRVHANFAEYAPYTLILMALGELNGAPWWLVSIVGLALIFGRLAHAYGMSKSPDNFGWRVRGMFSTFLALALGALIAAGFGVASLL